MSRISNVSSVVVTRVRGEALQPARDGHEEPANRDSPATAAAEQKKHDEEILMAVIRERKMNSHAVPIQPTVRPMSPAMSWADALLIAGGAFTAAAGGLALAYGTWAKWDPVERTSCSLPVAIGVALFAFGAFRTARNART